MEVSAFSPQAISLAAITNTAVCFANLYPDLFHPMFTELQGFFFSFPLLDAGSKICINDSSGSRGRCQSIFLFVCFFPPVFGFIDLQ